MNHIPFKQGSSTIVHPMHAHSRETITAIVTKRSLETRNAHWQKGGQYTKDWSCRSHRRSAKQKMLQNEINDSRSAAGNVLLVNII